MVPHLYLCHCYDRFDKSRAYEHIKTAYKINPEQVNIKESYHNFCNFLIAEASEHKGQTKKQNL